ncbi:MAG: hypothetical protein ACK5MW_07310 [Enterococcus sp.]
MKVNLKESLTTAAEKVYDVFKSEHYRIEVKGKEGVKVSQLRPTKHSIKWRSKNH